MRANEMFWILLHDCREMSAYIDQEINNNGSNGNIELLKEYLDKTMTKEDYPYQYLLTMLQQMTS